MHHLESTFAGTVLIAACCLVANAVAADEAPGTIGRSDCRIVNPNPMTGERVEWSGACKDGFAQGPGVLAWYIDDVLGSRYRGTLINGRPDGSGEYDHMRTNMRYEGEFREGRRHGQGRLTLPNGSVLAGQFDRGEPSGEVTITGPGSFRYQGGWRQGQPQGVGRLTNPDGSSYEGGFERGLREGRGRLVDPNGTVFEGTFSAGELHGEGHVRARNGADYVGGLQNARPHGRGIFVYSDGVRYEGEFRFGVREGQGALVTPLGRRLEGNWMANELDGRGIEVLPGGERREGGFKAGLLSGQAKVWMPDGRTFVGEFEHGVRHGPGVETSRDGVRTEGKWVKGVLDANAEGAGKSGERLVQRPAIESVGQCAPTGDDYPLESRRLNEQGTTKMRFMVNADGKLARVDVVRSSGHPRLDEVAVRKLSACSFKAARDTEGRPVDGVLEVDYAWRLN